MGGGGRASLPATGAEEIGPGGGGRGGDMEREEERHGDGDGGPATARWE